MRLGRASLPGCTNYCRKAVVDHRCPGAEVNEGDRGMAQASRFRPIRGEFETGKPRLRDALGKSPMPVPTRTKVVDSSPNLPDVTHN